MLHRGANPSLPSQDNRTPLHIGVQKKYESVCSKLLMHGASPFKRDRDGITPFKIAYDEENDSIAAMLIKYANNKEYVSQNFFPLK